MTNYSNVHELVSDLVACALIEGARPTSFSASIETKRVKQLLLNEIEDRSRELRKLKAHGNEPNRGSQGAGETMPVAKPVRRPASLTHEPNEQLRVCPRCDRNWISGKEACDCEPGAGAPRNSYVTFEKSGSVSVDLAAYLQSPEGKAQLAASKSSEPHRLAICPWHGSYPEAQGCKLCQIATSQRT